MPGPLDGVRIVDLTTMISGPFATMMLGDQGADVIKVESPGTGDLLRYFGTTRGGLAAIFTTSNRNKRSVVLNLKEPRGVEIVCRLVEGADVFVQNFRPGAAERMGIGEAVLREVQPDLVYVSISGFGETGPYSHQRVYDPVIQALSGLASTQGDPGTGRPAMVRTILPDKLTSVTAAQAISAALFARERTGKGQHVRLAMLDSVVAWLWPDGMMNHTYLGDDVTVTPPVSTLNLVFETVDGYVTAGALSDAEWHGMCRALEREDLLSDPRFGSVAERSKNFGALIEAADGAMKKKTSAEMLARLDAEDVPNATILSRDEMVTSPQVEANELVVEYTHPHAGPMREPRPAARFDVTPSSIRRPAPSLGEHTDEVLKEIGVEDIEALRSAGVIQ
ncbi:MAG: CoA transferase [Gammaproteobacteria bacterium]|nr:CoA transferase [Gammaproteobacteria bacterium]